MVHMYLPPGVDGDYQTIRIEVPGFGLIFINHSAPFTSHPDDGKSLLEESKTYPQCLQINVMIDNDDAQVTAFRNNRKASSIEWTIPLKEEE